MDAHTVFVVIIAVVIAGYVWDTLLDWLNTRTWQPTMPPELADFYTPEKYDTARQYHREHERLSVIGSFVSFVAMLLMLLLGGFAWLDDLLRNHVTEHWLLLPIVYFAVLVVASKIAGLPFSIYGTFVIEEKYGFNKTTPGIYIADTIKGLALMAIFGGGFFALFIWFYHATGSLFWLWGFLASAAVMLLVAMFYTSLIVPLFNKLTPLDDGELRSTIEQYAKAVDFKLQNVFVIDGSKRSTKANAFFSGLGPKKTIALYDTLVEKYSVPQLVAVLAHEVGHYKKKHTMQMIAASLLSSFLMFALLGLFLNRPIFSYALGAEEHSVHMGMIAFGVLYSPVALLLGLMTSAISRRNEFQADAFAVDTADGSALASALRKLSVDHLANLQPHWLYVMFHYSHPPLLQRLGAIEAEIERQPSQQNSA